MAETAEYVLDASAVISYLEGEPGSDEVARVLARAAISTVNLAEVATHVFDMGLEESDANATLLRLRRALVVVDFDVEDSLDAGSLRRATRTAGLSMGDRACLALARRIGAKVKTADRPWKSLDVGVRIELIR